MQNCRSPERHILQQHSAGEHRSLNIFAIIKLDLIQCDHSYALHVENASCFKGNYCSNRYRIIPDSLFDSCFYTFV